jgi:hypothetical protein
MIFSRIVLTWVFQWRSLFTLNFLTNTYCNVNIHCQAVAL